MKKEEISKNKLKAFTIAEMTVVLLILSIVLAAILPVTTTRKSGGSGGGSAGALWKLARNNTDVWFATPASTQSVLMGTSQTPDNSGNARLYINTPNSTSKAQIGFMYNNSTVGYFKYKNNNNLSIGVGTMAGAISGTNNLGIGQDTLAATTSGSSNTAIGYYTLRSQTTAVGNAAMGYKALTATTTGGYNNAFGYNAMLTNTTGNNNNAFGKNALYTNSTGTDNIAIGQTSLYATTGSNNTALGYQSLAKNITGANNVALGPNSAYGNTSGTENIAIGNAAMNGSNTGNYNVGIGYQAYYTASSNGSSNTAVGNQALYKNSSGSYNVGLGYRAGYNITTGTANTALGELALSGNTTGSNNVGVGLNACNAVSGSFKTCLGANSGSGTLPSGFNAANTDTAQTIIGSGGGDIFLHAGNVYTRASNAATGVKMTSGGNLEATNNIYAYNNLAVTKAITAGTDITAANNVTAGNIAYANTTYTNRIQSRTGPTYSAVIYGTFTGTYNPVSDKRLKNIEGFANVGLNEIKKLDVYNFTFKEEPKVKRVGVMAQDVQKIIPFAVKKNEDGYLTLIQDNIIYTMFNAIKDLDKICQNTIERLNSYVQRLILVEDRVQALIQVNQELSKRVDKLEKRVEALEKNQCKCNK